MSLFYLEGTRMMAVAVETEPTFEAGIPETLFTLDWIQPTSSFDVAAEGRFVMIRDDTPPATSIEVVVNRDESAGTLTELAAARRSLVRRRAGD